MKSNLINNTFMIRRRKNITAARVMTVIMAAAFISSGRGICSRAEDINFKDAAFKNTIERQWEINCGEGSINPFKVSIDDKEIWNLQGIQNYQKIQSISIDSSSVADLMPITNLKELKDLTVKDSCVTSLDFLDNCKNLQHLALENLNIDDFSKLVELENLESLRINKCNIRDLSFLENLQNLRELNLNDNYIDDISEIGKLQNLRWLELDNNEITDASPLLNLSAPENDEACSSARAVYLYNNVLDKRAKKVKKALQNIGYDVHDSEQKKAVHPIKINDNKYEECTSINLDGDIVIEYNQDISERDNQINIQCSYGEKTIENLPYTIEGNLLKIELDGALKDCDDGGTIVIYDGSSPEESDYQEYINFAKDYDEINCDIDGNGVIELNDLTELAKDYNKNSRDADIWNYEEDLNRNGVIDVYDLVKIAAKL